MYDNCPPSEKAKYKNLPPEEKTIISHTKVKEPSTTRASTSRRVGLGFYNSWCESHKSYQYLLPSTMRASTSRRVGLGFYNSRCESHKSYQYLLAAGMVSRISDILGVSRPIAGSKSPLPFGESFK